MPLDISKLGASPSSASGVATPSFTLALIPGERPPVGSSVRTPAAGRAFPAVAPAPGYGVPGNGGSPGGGITGAPGSGGVTGAPGPRVWAGDLAKRGLPVEVTSGVLSGPDGAFARGVVAPGASVNPALTGANARGEIWFGPGGQVAAPSDAMIAALDRVETGRRGDPLTPADWRAHAAFLKAYPGGRSPANPSAPGLTQVMPDFALLALTPLPAGVPEEFFTEARSRAPFSAPYSREAAAVLGSPPLVDFSRRVRPEDAAALDRLAQAANASPALRVYARYTLANTGSMDMVRAVLDRGEAGLPRGPLPEGDDLPKGEMFRSPEAFLAWRNSARQAPWPGLTHPQAARLAQSWMNGGADPAKIVLAAKALIEPLGIDGGRDAERRIDLPETGLPGGDDVARVAEETGLPAQEIARVQQEYNVSAKDAADILKSAIFGRWSGTGGAPAGAPPLPPGSNTATAAGGDDLSPEQVAQNIRTADIDVVRKWWNGLSYTEKAGLPTVIIQAVGLRLADAVTASHAAIDRNALTGDAVSDTAAMKTALEGRAVLDLGIHPSAARSFVDQAWSKFEDSHRSPEEIGLIFDRFIDRAARFVRGRASQYLARAAPSLGPTIRADLFARLIGPNFGYTVPAALDVVSDPAWSDAALIRAQQAFFTSNRVDMDLVLLQMRGPDARTVMSYLGQTNVNDPTVYGPVVRRITRGELTTVDQALRAENEPPGGPIRDGRATEIKELTSRAVEILEGGKSVKIVREQFTSRVIVDRAQGDEQYAPGDLYIHNYGPMMGYVATGATDFWVRRYGEDAWTQHLPHGSESLGPGDSVRVAPMAWRTIANFPQQALPGAPTVPDESRSITIEMPPY